MPASSASPAPTVTTPITATGKYEATTGNPNKYVMNYNGDEFTLRGQGYLRIRWQIIYTTGRVGVIAIPSWTGLSGKLFHVASGDRAAALERRLNAVACRRAVVSARVHLSRAKVRHLGGLRAPRTGDGHVEDR